MTARPVTVRQLVEGMTLGFDASEGAGAGGVLELAVDGEERGTYRLVIAGGSCRFELGPGRDATLRVETDAAVWRSVVENRLDPVSAVRDGRMTVSGDLSLFRRLPRLFRRVTSQELRAPAGARPPGPVRLRAMTWLLVAMIPWKAFWILQAVWGGAGAIVVAFALASVVWGSRELRGGASFLERATVLVFGAGAAALAVGAHAPTGQLPQSLLVLSAIWAASVVHARWPLTAEYARWSYVPRLWPTALFRHPNVVLSLLWSGIFAALGLLGAAAAHGWTPRRVADPLGLALCAAGAAFTKRHEHGARDRRIDDLDASLARMGAAARLLVAMAACALLLLGPTPLQSGWTLIPAAMAFTLAIWPGVAGRLSRGFAADTSPAPPGSSPRAGSSR